MPKALHAGAVAALLCYCPAAVAQYLGTSTPKLSVAPWRLDAIYKADALYDR